jgi:hypothetical protein
MPSLIGNLMRLQIILLPDRIIANIRTETEKHALRDPRSQFAFAHKTGWSDFTPLGEHFVDTCVREGNALE